MSSQTMSNKPTNDTYPLGRDAIASVRLNLQHQLWTLSTSSLLHPSVPIPAANALIADIGTGTGIWSTTLAASLPSSAKIEAFDLDLAQSPPKAWTPENVSFHELDVLGDIPENLVGRFDVVHVRLLMLIVQHGNPMPLLKNLMKLVKVGGYLHWQEYDSLSQKLVIAGEEGLSVEASGERAPALENLRQRISVSTAVQQDHAWVTEVHEKFAEVGGVLVKWERQWTVKEAMLIKQDITFLAVREWCTGLKSKGMEEVAEELEMLCSEAERECWEMKRGAVVDTQMVTWVVRKDA